jgi:hypothetical protein
VAEPITLTADSYAAMSKLAGSFVVQTFPALLFADDRGREGA